jgi:hypothetical protein
VGVATDHRSTTIRYAPSEPRAGSVTHPTAVTHGWAEVSTATEAALQTIDEADRVVLAVGCHCQQPDREVELVLLKAVVSVGPRHESLARPAQHSRQIFEGVDNTLGQVTDAVTRTGTDRPLVAELLQDTVVVGSVERERSHALDWS